MKTSILFLTILAGTATLTIQSTGFKSRENIPAKYTCSGANINPPLTITDIPKGAKTLALILDDPDAPAGNFVHWVVWNIPVVKEIAENSIPGVQGLNGKNENKYTGPCPPSGTHHYHFKVYALDTKLELPANTDKFGLEGAMKGHILANGDLIGLFKK